jgi:hypothetical protein
MATRVLHGIKFLEQFLKVTTCAVGFVVYEEMLFKVKVYGRTTEEQMLDEL